MAKIMFNVNCIRAEKKGYEAFQMAKQKSLSVFAFFNRILFISDRCIYGFARRKLPNGENLFNLTLFEF